MKKVSLILLIVAAPLFLRAQDSSSRNYPYWTISKDIHRQAYRSVTYAPVTFDITDLSALVSKNIQRKRTTASKPAALPGYPSWSISKPAARQAFERSNKKKQ